MKSIIPKDPDTRRKLIIVIIVLSFLSLFGLFITGIPLATNPNYCGQLCHATNPEYQTWTRSSHGEIACHFCHTDHSYIGLYWEKFVDPIRRYNLVRSGNFDKPLNADSSYSQKDIPKEICLRCHSPKTRNFTGARGLNITSAMHLKHLAAGLQCTTCHNRVTHKGATKYEPLKSEWKVSKTFRYKDYLTMQQGCWRCHSDNPKYRDEKTLKIIKNGKTPPTSCITCHNQLWNRRPTVGEYNHSDVNGIAWKVGTKRHGIVAMKDFNACFACHQQTGVSANGLPNCSTTCHQGITMPHNIPKRAAIYAKRSDAPPPWRHIHYKVAAKQGTAMCQRCHNPNRTQTNFCQTCHHQQFAGVKPEEKTVNWKGIHFMVVKKIGAAKCFQCHQPNFCANCHTTGIKPSPGRYFNMKY